MSAFKLFGIFKVFNSCRCYSAHIYKVLRFLFILPCLPLGTHFQQKLACFCFIFPEIRKIPGILGFCMIHTMNIHEKPSKPSLKPFLKLFINLTKRPWLALMIPKKHLNTFTINWGDSGQWCDFGQFLKNY